MKILTPTGYQPYYKIQKKTADCIKIVFTDGTSITCSKDHRFACYDYKSLNINEYEIVAEKLRKGVTIEELHDITKITAYFLETIKKIAEELKFSSVEFFGDYLKSPFNKNSSNLICVLTK